MKAAGANYESGRQRRKFRKGFNRALRAKQRELNAPKPVVVQMSGNAMGGSRVAA
jgi:enoyl-CoA hydratase/carnithine racemase